MLIKCPKCNFTQPKDHYCAQCGVNMDKHVPEKDSLLKIIFSHLFFQIGFVTLFSVLIITYFFSQKDLAQKNAPTYKKKIYSSFTQSPSNQDLSQKEIQPQTENLNQNSNSNENEQKFSDGTVNTSETLTQTQSDAALKQVKLTIPLYISFYEIDRELINFWTKQSLTHLNEKPNETQSDEKPGIKSGQITMTQFRQQVRDKALLSDNRKIELQKKEIYSYGMNTNSVENFSGFKLEFQFSQIVKDRIIGQLNLYKINGPLVKNMNIDIELNKEKMFFLNWKDDLNGFQNNLDLYKYPPFQIFKSERFVSEKTDFVFILYSDFIFNEQGLKNDK